MRTLPSRHCNLLLFPALAKSYIPVLASEFVPSFLGADWVIDLDVALGIELCLPHSVDVGVAELRKPYDVPN